VHSVLSYSVSRDCATVSFSASHGSLCMSFEDVLSKLSVTVGLFGLKTNLNVTF